MLAALSRIHDDSDNGCVASIILSRAPPRDVEAEPPPTYPSQKTIEDGSHREENLGEEPH